MIIHISLVPPVQVDLNVLRLNYLNKSLSKECFNSHRASIVVSFWITVMLRSYFEFTKNYFISLCFRVNDEKHCTVCWQTVTMLCYFKHGCTYRTTFPNTFKKLQFFLTGTLKRAFPSLNWMDTWLAAIRAFVSNSFILKLNCNSF